MEIVMVVVILGMLAAMALPKYLEQREQAKIDLTKQNLQALRIAVNNYYLTYKGTLEWPSDDLSDLVFDSKSQGKDRKFIEKIPLEAISNSDDIVNTHDGLGGWVWDTTDHKIFVNLDDHPSDPRKKYSEW